MNLQETCTQLLRQELCVAMGCTEPIALAFSAAYARKILGEMPQRFEVACSGGILKNANSVTVPKTGDLKGVAAALIAGAVSNRADLKLELLSVLNDSDQEIIKAELQKNNVKISLLETEHPLHIITTVYSAQNKVSVEIVDFHTNISAVCYNGQRVQQHQNEQETKPCINRKGLTVLSILQYANTVDIDHVREILQKQIDYNNAISEEGMQKQWGECVGQTLYPNDTNSLYSYIKAATAAGSDARMNGCAMPVVINSGSGNQGLTASLPVIAYAKFKHANSDSLLRALCVSNLIAVHQKTFIGALSAYCGVVCAATGAAAGIAYLDGQAYSCISNTIINSICTIGGMVCDGAKSSCAAKISAALDAAFTAYEMAKRERVFRNGEGLVREDVEKTIAGIGRLAKQGMEGTNIEIIKIMINQ